MENISFFTPIRFGDHPKSTTERLLETVDSYFLGRTVAHVVPSALKEESQGAILLEYPLPFLTTALKVISYMTVVLPLVMVVAKIILRSTHSFHVIDPKKQLEEGIVITPEITATIERLMPQILSGEHTDEITWHSRGNNLVFSLTCASGLIFKMSTHGALRGRDGILSAEQTTKLRFSNTLKAKTVCLIHQLGLLIIPRTKLFTVGDTPLIAEERMAIYPDESVQERAYHELDNLDETTRQLATLVAKTGFSDVEWRNIPLLDIDPASSAPRRVALIDMEEMDSEHTGIYGGAWRRGLIHCLGTEAQIDCALAVAKRHRVPPLDETTETIKRRRLEEITAYHQLMAFYALKGIDREERQPITVPDLETLGLPLETQGVVRTFKMRATGTGELTWERVPHPITLRQAVEDVIQCINVALAEARDTASTKGKRFILIPFNGPTPSLSQYHNQLKMPDSEKYWLEAIVEALVEKGHLFKLSLINGNGCFIQA